MVGNREASGVERGHVPARTLGVRNRCFAQENSEKAGADGRGPPGAERHCGTFLRSTRPLSPKTFGLAHPQTRAEDGKSASPGVSEDMRAAALLQSPNCRSHQVMAARIRWNIRVTDLSRRCRFPRSSGLPDGNTPREASLAAHHLKPPQ